MSSGLRCRTSSRADFQVRPRAPGSVVVRVGLLASGLATTARTGLRRTVALGEDRRTVGLADPFVGRERQRRALRCQRGCAAVKGQQTAD
jgi:hypothetical protein